MGEALPDALTLGLLYSAAVLLDGHSTARALRRGHHEMNPLMPGLIARAPWKVSLAMLAAGLGVLGLDAGLIGAGIWSAESEAHRQIATYIAVISVGKLLAALNNYLLLWLGASPVGALRRALGRRRSRLRDLLALILGLALPALLITDWLFPGLGLHLLAHMGAGAG